MASGSRRVMRNGTHYGIINTFSVLHSWVAEHKLAGYSDSTVGWIFSIHAFIVYFAGAQVGA